MVTRVSPTRLVYNSAQNTYAVLVQRTPTSFYYVKADGGGNILPPPYSHRYGAEYTTASAAIANIPAGFVDNSLPTCERGPTLYTADGNPALINITPTGLTFRFDGVGLTLINWRIKQNGSVVRSGSVVPTTNNVFVSYTSLSSGAYTFEIEGGNCQSVVSSAAFNIGNENQKYLVIGWLPFDSVADTLQTIAEHIAKGFNAIHVVTQPMDLFFSNYTDFQNNVPHNNTIEPAYTGNAWDNWLLPLLTGIKNNHPTIPVFVRVQIAMNVWPNLQNLPEYAGKTPWWPIEDSVTNEWGYLANNNGSGIRRNPSFASATARQRIFEFLNWLNPRMVAALNPGQLKWYSYATGNTYEYGFSQETPAFDPFTGTQLATNYFFHGDYSQAAIASYRTYLTEKYGNISSINLAHGTSFASINDITPPVSNQPAPTNSSGIDVNLYFNTYQGQRGQDWGQARIRDLYRFLNAMPNISGSEEIVEVGHLAYDISVITMGGASRLFRDNFGKMKVAQDPLDIINNRDVHSDFFASHLNQPMWGELAVFDIQKYVVTGQISNITAGLDAFVNRYIQAGAEFYLSVNSKNSVGYAAFRDYWTPERVANFYNTPKFIPNTSNWPQFNITYQEWSTTRNLILNRWLAAGGSNSVRVKINYTEPQIFNL